MALENINAQTLKSFQFIANCTREKGSKLTRKEFYNRLSNVRRLRSQVYTSVLSFYITSVEEHNLLKKIHSIVNGAKFDLDNEFSRKVFMLGLPPKLHSWFSNLEFDTIYNQILNWFTASYLFDDGKDKIIERQVHEPLVFKIKQLAKEYEKSINQEILENYTLQQELYNEMSKNLTGAMPPECLEYFGSVPYFDEWGINTEMNFDIAIAYLRDDDWEHIIVEKSNDDLKRSESVSLLLEQWKMIFGNYESTKSNIIKKLKFKTKQDYLYVIQEGDSNRYKIGWTTNPNIEKKRLSQMQTGNSNVLKLIDSFEISSKQIETAFHRLFKNSNIHREWFLLTQQEVRNMLSVEWRRKNNFL